MRIDRIGTLRCGVGEGPLWDVREQMLYFVDTSEHLIWRYDPASGDLRRWTVPSKIGSLALRDGGGAILALANGFHRFDFETGDAILLADPRLHKERTRFNDGKVDPRG